MCHQSGLVLPTTCFCATCVEASSSQLSCSCGAGARPVNAVRSWGARKLQGQVRSFEAIGRRCWVRCYQGGAWWWNKVTRGALRWDRWSVSITHPRGLVSSQRPPVNHSLFVIGDRGRGWAAAGWQECGMKSCRRHSRKVCW